MAIGLRLRPSLFPVIQTNRLVSWDEHECLPIEPRLPDGRAQTRPGREIEGDNLVLGDAVKAPPMIEAQTTWFAEFRQTRRGQHADQAPIARVVFAHRGHSIRRAEWTFAGDNDIAVRCDRQVEWTEFPIIDLPGRNPFHNRIERADRVVALTIRTGPGREEQAAIRAVCETTWKGHDTPRQNAFAGLIESCRKSHDAPLRPHSDDK